MAGLMDARFRGHDGAGGHNKTEGNHDVFGG